MSVRKSKNFTAAGRENFCFRSGLLGPNVQSVSTEFRRNLPLFPLLRSPVVPADIELAESCSDREKSLRFLSRDPKAIAHWRLACLRVTPAPHSCPAGPNERSRSFPWGVSRRGWSVPSPLTLVRGALRPPSVGESHPPPGRGAPQVGTCMDVPSWGCPREAATHTSAPQLED